MFLLIYEIYYYYYIQIFNNKKNVLFDRGLLFFDIRYGPGAMPPPAAPYPGLGRLY
jgi:hypothetical protein